MKPHRIRMCHSLVMNYGLYNKMEIYVSCLSFPYDIGVNQKKKCVELANGMDCIWISKYRA